MTLAIHSQLQMEFKACIECSCQYNITIAIVCISE